MHNNLTRETHNNAQLGCLIIPSELNERVPVGIIFETPPPDTSGAQSLVDRLMRKD